MKNIYGITLNKLEEYFISKGEKKFKAQQVYDWLNKKRVKTFDEMSNIKKDIIETLKQDFEMSSIKIITKQDMSSRDRMIFIFKNVLLNE